ncbi:mitochondrial carrier [Martensiomyces pterosporus]|nr:mitochondrial carrier [Martensiomyces pterosporus]
MSDFADSNGAQGQGNPYRPYADSFGSKSGASSGGIYDELRNPLEGLRNATADSQFAGNPLALSGLSSDVNGVRLENLDSADLDLYTEHVDTAQAATELVKFAGYRYLATLAACPFSISQTLLQVQYLPLAAKHMMAAQGEKTGEERAEEFGDDDEAPDPDDPAYYDYLRARQNGSSAQYRAAARARVDHRGYIVGTQEKDVGDVKPGYQLDALPEAKFTVLRRLVAHPTEGFLSLFKGAFSQWAYDMLHLLLQPTLEGLLNEMLGLYDSAPISTYVDSSAPSVLTLIGSNVVVGWLLSPLELVRTRLMIQSASPIHRKYNGTLHALKAVAREEGGLAALYLSPFHLIPTLIKHTLDPVFRNLGSFALDRVAGIDPYDQPTTFALGGLIWKTISVAVMLPVDTVRARLQAQTRYTVRTSSGSSQLSASKRDSGKGKQTETFREFRTCVPLSTVPYTGMANCAWRIFAEEGESLRQLKKRRAAAAKASLNGDDERSRLVSNVGHYGLRGLYPGFTLQLVANVAIFGLGFISTDDMDDGF